MTNTIDMYLLGFAKIVARFIYKWTGITNYTLTKGCLILSGINIFFIIFFILHEYKLDTLNSSLLIIIQICFLSILYLHWIEQKQNLLSCGKFLNPGRIDQKMKFRRLKLFAITIVLILFSDWYYTSFFFFWFMALCFGSIEPEDPNDSMWKKALNYLGRIFSSSPVPQMG